MEHSIMKKRYLSPIGFAALLCLALVGFFKVDGFVKTGKWPWLRYRLLLFIWLILQRSQPSQ